MILGKMGLEASFGIHTHLRGCTLGCAVYTCGKEIVDVIFYIYQVVFVTIFTERTRCFIVDGLFCAAAALADHRVRACHISHVSIEWEMSSFKSCGGQLNPVGVAISGKVVGYVGFGSYKW